MAFTFDGPNKLIILTSGTTTVDVRDMFSRWKDWVTTGNAQFLPAFNSVGGDDIDTGAGTKIPPYLFLLNGWRVRPQEASHTLNITTGILLVDGGGDPFVDTLGAFIVRILYQQPVQAITVATGGTVAPTQQQIRDAMKLAASAGSPASGSVDLRLLELYRLMGLDPTKPLVVSATARTAGAEVSQTIVDAAGTVTVTRQP